MKQQLFAGFPRHSTAHYRNGCELQVSQQTSVPLQLLPIALAHMTQPAVSEVRSPATGKSRRRAAHQMHVVQQVLQGFLHVYCP
jgi:hypothetical protein